MTGPFAVRRNADEFNAALSRTGEPLTDRDARQFTELLAVVRDLRSIPELEPRPEFVADLRSRLMTAAETALLPQPARPLTTQGKRISVPVGSHSRDRRLAAVLGGAALIGATTSMAVAAQTALPGESLYTVKRAIEEARTGIARDDAAKGQTMLDTARARLDEVGELAARNDPISALALEPTLEAFSVQAQEASQVLLEAYDQTGEETLLLDLRTFVSESMDRLSSLQTTLPPSSREALIAAGGRLQEIDRLTSQACPSCGGPASVPPALLSDAGTLLDMETVIISASQDPDLINPADLATQAPATPDTISGQDVGDVTVPELVVPGDDDPSAPATTPTENGTTVPDVKGAGVKETGVKGDEVKGTGVEPPATEVTKLLTGDLEEATSGLPVTNEVVGGVGTAIDGTLAELQDTVTGTPGSLLP